MTDQQAVEITNQDLFDDLEMWLEVGLDLVKPDNSNKDLDYCPQEHYTYLCNLINETLYNLGVNKPNVVVTVNNDTGKKWNVVSDQVGRIKVF